MSTFVPENAVVWFEIPVSNMAKAKAFYEAVIGLTLIEDNNGPNPMLLFPTQDPASGVSGHLYPGKPASAGGATIHLAVPAPLESALERVKVAGGEVISETITIPPGSFAYCKDLDGNSIGLFVRN